MKTKDDVLNKITELYEKAISANEFGIAYDLVALAAILVTS